MKIPSKAGRYHLFAESRALEASMLSRRSLTRDKFVLGPACSQAMQGQVAPWHAQFPEH